MGRSTRKRPRPAHHDRRGPDRTQRRPLWVALAIALPPALTAAARGINEILTGISAFRTASMHRRQTDRLLDEITDPTAGLDHLERVQTNAAPAIEVAITDPPAAPP